MPTEIKTLDAETVGDALLQLMAARGIDYLFANGGTDFAPLIEAYVRAGAIGLKVPKPVTVPHENVAVAAAMGYYLVSGRTQAVMVHVNVGVANALCGLFNARRANIPVLFASGRTPITEKGHQGSRNIHIHWTQEMFDQAGILREAVKWDYELRNGSQLETVVDRALRIANSEPKGPVYLSLPREVLLEPLDGLEYSVPSRHATAAPPHPDSAAIDELAGLIDAASWPVIITSGLGQDPAAVPVLEALAERFAIPVVQHVPRAMSIRTDHPMHFGYDPAPFLARADLVLVVECSTPWIPVRTGPQPGARVAHMTADPLYGDLPIHGFECDIAITSTVAAGLATLHARLAELGANTGSRIEARRERLARQWADLRTSWHDALQRTRTQTPIHPAWLTHCVDQAKDIDAIVVREAPTLDLTQLSMTRPASLIHCGASGGLGWGLGAAVGARMAAPERQVIACEGDGAYMFGVPVSAHYVALEQDAPFMTVIYNNRRWNEVRNAAHHIFPDGHAAKSNAAEPLTYFHEGLRLEKAVETVGGHGECITDPAALPDALARGLRMVEDEGRQVVLNVMCG